MSSVWLSLVMIQLSLFFDSYNFFVIFIIVLFMFIIFAPHLNFIIKFHLRESSLLVDMIICVMPSLINYDRFFYHQ